MARPKKVEIDEVEIVEKEIEETTPEEVDLGWQKGVHWFD